jgi:hypothetical protein
MITRHQSPKSPFSESRFYGAMIRFGFLMGALFLFLFWWVNFVTLKSVFLFLGIALVTTGLLRAVSIFIHPLPDGHYKRLAMSVAMAIASLFLILQSRFIFLKVIASLFLIYGFPAGLFAIQEIVIESLLLRELLKSHKEKRLPDLLVPFVYVFAEPGFAVYYSHRISSRIRTMLYKFRRQHWIQLLVSDSVSRYSADFQKWLVGQAVALLIIRADVFTNEQFESMFNIQDYEKICLGKILTIFLQPKNVDSTLASQKGEVLEVLVTPALEGIGSGGEKGINALIARLTDEFAMTTFPIAESDFQLSDDLRTLMKEIAEHGLTPVANSYLRFRLAKSDVERFLGLLDCIESLIKCSAIVLLVNQWVQSANTDLADLHAQLNRPSLGHWIGILRELIRESGEDELEKHISAFWEQPLLHAPQQLITDVNGSGLSWRGNLPRSHLAWLDWFVWLRNATRGHGVVAEEFVSPLWHGFHETFLQMVSGLRPLVLSSTLAVLDEDGEPASFQGWNRDGKSLDSESSEEIQPYDILVLLREGSQSTPPLLLFPLIIKQSHCTSLWNSVRGNAIEYIDYGSGDLQRLVLADTDPYNMWSEAHSEFLSTNLL